MALHTIRRDIQIAANTPAVRLEPDVDLDIEAETTSPIDVMLGAFDGDEIQYTTVEWHTPHGVAIISVADGGNARMAPSILVDANDRQFVVAGVEGTDGTDRSIYAELDSSVNYSFELLPRLTDQVTFEDGPSGLKASWSELPVIDPDWLIATVSRHSLGAWQFFASASWLARRNLTELELDITPPGFEERWIIVGPADDDEVGTSFKITQKRDGIERETGMRDFPFN